MDNLIPSFPNAFAPPIRSLLDEINRLIGPIYLVGDAPWCGILGKPLPNTLEILVARPLAECRKRLSRGDITSAVLGNKHNSLLLPLKEWTHPKILDIATFRNRPGHPSTLEEDLLHRDLTVNAMAWTWPSGPLVDPFGGRKDLLTGEIRLVNGSTTLKDNPLRALLFFRFAMQLNRPPNQEDLILAEQTSLETILPEPIRSEMDRILALPLADEASQHLLHALCASPITDRILPHFSLFNPRNAASGAEDPWKRILDVTLAITPPGDDEEISLLDLRWATLLGGPALLKLSSKEHMEKNLNQINKHLELFLFSKRRSRRILSLLRNLNATTSPSDRQLKRFLQDHVPVEGVYRILQAINATDSHLSEEARVTEDLKFQQIRSRCHILRQAEERLSPNDLALSGGEILDLVRRKPGPWLRDLQATLVDLVIKDPSRNRPAELTNIVQQWIRQQREI
ncbi:MAG: hypothetical protein HQL96_14395 [Magnetococcales bacterium]|nr:hypothetical protein [Magnetococcales bacterium]